jgi:SH3-like domain-containing protein
MSFPRPVRKSASPWAKSALLPIPLALLVCLGISGCNRLRPQPRTEIVYVLAKETYLRDRVAAVSNRVAMVQNGQRLELLERDRRFLKVKTDKGETGWIEEHAVVNPEVVNGFEQLQKAQAHDPVVGTAVLRDDGYLHLKPGRDTDRYYLLPEGDKLQLLLRAYVPKAVGPQASGTGSSFASVPSPASGKKLAAKSSAALAKAEKEKAAEKAPPAVSYNPASPPPPPDSMTTPGTASDDATPGPPPAPPAPTPMEDWWMVRDSQGRVGWLMTRRIDVDVPDDIAGYAEGQKMVAAYLLRKVYDPESNFPDKQAPEYVTVLNPYQDGLPFDFNQVRVFTWNVRKHRYETAFRQRNLQGYLPVVVASQAGGKDGPAPTFQVTQGVGDSVTIDPDTGVAKPTSTQMSTYVLEEDRVRKVGPESPVAAKISAPAAATGKMGQRAVRKKRARAQHRHSN